MSNSEIFVSLDIGTSTVKVMIGEMSDNSLNVIGIGRQNLMAYEKEQLLILIKLSIQYEKPLTKQNV